MLRVFYWVEKLIPISNSTYTFLYYLLILISGMSTAVIGQFCQKQSDCNDGDSINCGICTDNDNQGVGKCYFPFPYKFTDNVKCRNITVCDDNCNQHGICSSYIPAFPKSKLIPSCFCDKEFYGRTCKNSIPQNLVGRIFQYVGFTFIGAVKPNGITIHEYFCVCGVNKLEAFGLAEVECDDGRYYEDKQMSTRRCVDNITLMFEFRSRFPYKLLTHEVKDKYLLLGNTILGYLSTYRFKITMEGTINSQQNISVFVSYTDTSLVCVPVIQLSGCALTKEYSVVYTQLSYIKISSQVFYIADGKYLSTSVKKMECKNNANYHWKIWNNSHHDLGEPIGQFYEKEELSLDPLNMKLPFGSYRVLLEVNIVQENPSKNFAYCYFNITKVTQLVAIIDGGSERTVSKETGLILSTTRSRDPNMPQDKQDHMMASWSCVDISNPENTEICDPLLSLPVSNSYYVSHEKLCYGCFYKITLKVWATNKYYTEAPAPAYANAIITIANKSDVTENYMIYIQCLLNCNEKVIHNQQLYLRVKTDSGKNNNQYTWHYYEEGQTVENDTKSIAIEGIPSFMLIVKENSFSSGKSYVIVVRIADLKWFAKYSFDTKKVEFDGNCFISQTSGEAGLSLFKITCQNFSSSFTYEFYDKTPEEAQAGSIYNGRMLGSAERTGKGELKDFTVSRGEVFVYIIDNSGIYTHHQFTVNVSHWNISDRVISEIFRNLTELSNGGENEFVLRYVSFLTDHLPSKIDKHQVLNKLLNYINLSPSETLADVKLITSTLTNVLVNLSKRNQLVVEPALMREILRILKNQTELLCRIVGKGINLNGMSPQEIRLVATGQLKCLYTALMCKDPRTVGVTEFSCDMKTLDALMDISIISEDIIYLVKDILTFLQAPGQPPTQIALAENSYVVWVMENDEEYNLTNYLSEYKDIPVDVSNQFIKEFGTVPRKNQEELVLRVAIFNENIFWWPKSDVKSNLVSVSLARHSTKEHLGRIKFVENVVNMHISLDSGLNSTRVTDSSKPYRLGAKCSLDTDLAIKVHRLDPVPQSLTFLRFLFPETNGNLLVHVQSNYRPDCEMMFKKAINITEQSPNYPPILCSHHKPTFFFVGILSMNSQNVTYTLEVNTTVCQYWERGHWSSQGCIINDKLSTNSTAHCACNHFSVFAAAFPVPPQEVDPFSDIKLFLTVFDNFAVVSFVVVLLLIYFVCCIWARLKDKSDRNKRDVIILDDNFPEDCYPYLLTVYTSSRFNAGTTARVGIQIEGSSASSRPHILASRKRKVLKRNSDDWFLIHCPKPLGNLQSIHLWHDNAGTSPDWFCDKIIVYDLHNNNSEIVFVVEQWLALQLTYFPEAIVESALDSQVKSVKRIFLDNCVLGLREGHTLLCVVLRHPRSKSSRLQRISVLMCCVMSSMLCSIMFYSPQVDENEYNVELRDFYISVQSLVISLTTTFLVFFAFRRSYKYIKEKSRPTLRDEKNDLKEQKARKIKVFKQQSLYKNFVRFVLKTLKGQPLVPVQLENSEPVVVLRKCWLYIAWFLCVSVIIVCSFFVMLYGLKLGPVKSKIWLSSVFFVLSEDFFIATPAKIVFCSMILSLAFQQMSDPNKHRVNIKDTLGIESATSYEEDMQKLLVKRGHPVYAPVQTDLIYKMLEKKELWNNWWTLIDFTVALCFIFVVSIVVFEMWSSYYYTNNQVRSIATESRHLSLGSEHFLSITNMFQINNYLFNSVFQKFYNTFLYNQKAINETASDRGNWAEDFAHTMVGLLRYRQIRVKSEERWFKFLNATRICIPHYTQSNEDKESYSLRWKTAQWHDMDISNSPWNYTERSTSPFFTVYRLCGQSGTVFHNGGYLTDLVQTWPTSKSKAGELQSNNWQDQLTRAVFVELTFYNINVDLFTQLTIIVEYLLSQTIQLTAQVNSVESKMKLSFWNALFVIFVIYYVFRCGYLINRQGLLEYLRSSRNRSRLFVVFLGALSIVLATIHFLSSSSYYKSFINRGFNDIYFDFDAFIFYFLQLKIVLSCLLCLAIFRTIFIFRGGRTLLNYFYMLTLSLCWIISLTVVVIIFLGVEVLLVLLLNNMFPFHSVQKIIINSKFTTFLEIQSFEHSSILVILQIKSVSFNAFMSFYILIFLHFFKIAKRHKIKKSDEFNLFKFVLSQLK